MHNKRNESLPRSKGCNTEKHMDNSLKGRDYSFSESDLERGYAKDEPAPEGVRIHLSYGYPRLF